MLAESYCLDGNIDISPRFSNINISNISGSLNFLAALIFFVLFHLHDIFENECYPLLEVLMHSFSPAIYKCIIQILALMGTENQPFLSF